MHDMYYIWSNLYISPLLLGLCHLRSSGQNVKRNVCEDTRKNVRGGRPNCLSTLPLPRISNGRALISTHSTRNQCRSRLSVYYTVLCFLSSSARRCMCLLVPWCSEDSRTQQGMYCMLLITVTARNLGCLEWQCVTNNIQQETVCNGITWDISCRNLSVMRLHETFPAGNSL